MRTKPEEEDQQKKADFFFFFFDFQQVKEYKSYVNEYK